MAFQKGKSGNPGGRPKRGESLTDILNRLGDGTDVDYSGGKISRKQALSEAIWKKAIVDQDLMAIKYIFDRIDGTPVSRNEISGPDGESLTAIKIEFVSATENKD